MSNHGGQQELQGGDQQQEQQQEQQQDLQGGDQQQEEYLSLITVGADQESYRFPDFVDKSHVSEKQQEHCQQQEQQQQRAGGGKAKKGRNSKRRRAHRRESVLQIRALQMQLKLQRDQQLLWLSNFREALGILEGHVNESAFESSNESSD